MEPGHPHLLPAYFESDPRRSGLGSSFVRKPLFSREGANILIMRDGVVVAQDHGPYGAEGHVLQALALLLEFDGRSALVGSWIVGDESVGLCLREEAGPITSNRALFVPHVIEAS